MKMPQKICGIFIDIIFFQQSEKDLPIGRSFSLLIKLKHLLLEEELKSIFMYSPR
ncbi:hypothetical protein [Metabacillus litoralis]|uniref:hypothetical protein n=1 Tax=Metabacillus litoralis TaxID=152268 RepID=UPI0020403E27|nr:hypothetical protein [Metabacillus litoralis]